VGEGLETSIFNAKTSAEMERLEEGHVALHGPAPIGRSRRSPITRTRRPVAGRDQSASEATSTGSADEPRGSRT